MALAKTQQMINACLSSASLRLNENAFVRQRKLGPKWILRMLLEKLDHSIQCVLDGMFMEGKLPRVSKQAFSKARKNLNPALVREFADMTGEIAAQDNTLPMHLGRRLIAIDGSGLSLENCEELRQEYGCSGPGEGVATATASIAYGPLDGVIYDCQLARYGTSERDLARLHVQRLNELGLRGSLLLMDRGYPSLDFIADLIDEGYPFVIRARCKWNLKADAVKTQDWIEFTRNGRQYSFRVLKIRLSTGEIETLITTLHQKQLPIRSAGELYSRRWGVETAYDLLKSKLELENFSGKTAVSVQQDFYATVYLANLIAFADGVADERIEQNDADKTLKYSRKANRNLTVTHLRRIFLALLLETDPDVRDSKLERLYALIASHPVSVVPNRHPKRRIPRKKRFYAARKRAL